jgi:hypothetical protein
MRRRLARFLRALAHWVDPTVYQLRRAGPISQEDVDDFYGGVVPPGRWVIPPAPETEPIQPIRSIAP